MGDRYDGARHGALTPEQGSQIDALHARLDELAEVPLPGKGATWDRWQFLAGVGRVDLAHARLVEGHLDALAILHELGRPDLIEPGEAWGVWAAQPHLLAAERTAGGWHVRGAKGWCSGSIGLDVALVTATTADGPRLFVVDPADAEVDVDSWAPIGMAASASHTIAFDLRLPDDAAVGRPDDYVERAGFWHGGGGVAACWFGGALGVLDPLAERVGASTAPDQEVAALSFGTTRARLDACGALLSAVARAIDRHPGDASAARRGALAVRLAVEDVARHTLDTANVALGAGALCEDSPHSRSVADLTVYLRQLDVAGAAADYGRLAAVAPLETT